MRKLTTEEFISKSKDVHGDKYDYSLSEYKNAKTKVEIICKEHGIFEQNPYNHIKNIGCPRCSVMSFPEIITGFSLEKLLNCKIHKQKTFKECVSNKGKKLRFDFYIPKLNTLIEYDGLQHHTPIGFFGGKDAHKKQKKNDIIKNKYCKENNIELIRVPYIKDNVEDIIDFLSKKLDIFLSKRKRNNYIKDIENRKFNFSKTDEFIERVKEIHGGKYDYSEVVYKTAIKKVKIICPEHGIFEQTPNKHLLKRGCPVCGGSIKKTTEEFIKQSKEIHGDKYDYSLVDYTNTHTKVKIICPIHSIFEQEPNVHLHGNGCGRCGGTGKLTQEEFIKESKEVHGDKYDYSLVKYQASHIKVKIICGKHGVFEQRPSSHKQGINCQRCAKMGNTNGFKKKLILNESL